MKKTMQLDYFDLVLINESIDARINEITSKLITAERLDEPPQHMLDYCKYKIYHLTELKKTINK